MLETFPDEFTARLGAPGDPDAAVATPKIDVIDDQDVHHDANCERKQRD